MQAHASRCRASSASTPHTTCQPTTRPVPCHVATARHASCGHSACDSLGYAWPHTAAAFAQAGAPKTAAARGPVVVRSSAAAGVSTELLGRELGTEEVAQWQAASSFVASALGLSGQEADRLLARAFGWTSQAYWRREKVEEVPSLEVVEGALEFLRDDLNMGPEEQLKLVKAFPELLAAGVEGRLRPNVEVLQKQWRLQGDTLTKAVLRQPAVLGYSVDCGGDCVGECNRCWARF